MSFREKKEYLDLDCLDAHAFKLLNGQKSRMIGKRLFDIIFSFAILLICLPFALLLGFLIRLDSPGPIFFAQQRVGLNGSTYRMYKFRSMFQNNNKTQSAYAEVNDQRITKLGRFIRNHRIDEIPQILNVLKGEMSLIGPRPEQVDFAKNLKRQLPNYDMRLLVRPGITGWAQINVGYTDDSLGARLKVGYDLYYIKNISFGFDMKIVWQTFKVVLFGMGAR